MIIRMSLDTHVRCQKCVENTFVTHKGRGEDLKNTIFGCFHWNSSSKSLWGSMKSKKWPSAHVWGCIVALKYPKLTPFNSTRRHDYTKVLENIYDVSKSHKKFSRDPQSQWPCPLKHNFWAPHKQNCWKWSFKPKKWPLLRVCGRRMRLLHPKLTRIIFLQSYDHKDVSGNPC